MPDVVFAAAVVAAVVAVYTLLVWLAAGIDAVERHRAADDRQMIDRRMVAHLRDTYPNDQEAGTE